LKSREKVAEIVILRVGLVVLRFEFSDLIFEILDMLFLALPEGALRRPVLFLSLLQTRVVRRRRS